MLMISITDLDKKAVREHAHRLLRECLKPLGVNYSAIAEVYADMMHFAVRLAPKNQAHLVTGE